MAAINRIFTIIPININYHKLSLKQVITKKKQKITLMNKNENLQKLPNSFIFFI
ncbi:hypothetical protein Hanom_Chr13g01238131 [Helianthus anomalus]